MTVKLSSANLGNLPASVAAPNYDRAALTRRHPAFRRRQFPSRPPGGLSRRSVQCRRSTMTGRSSAPACSTARRRPRKNSRQQDWLTTVVEQDSGHMQARVTGVMIDFLMPGDARGDHRTARRSGDPHRLADHHRGRLFHRSGVRQFQPGASRHRRRRRKHRLRRRPCSA